MRIILKDGISTPRAFTVPEGTREWLTKEMVPTKIRVRRPNDPVPEPFFYETRWVPTGTVDARTGAVVFAPDWLLEKP